jgi:hypothetical protein
MYLYSDEFLAIVQGVLASMPAVRIAPADLDALVERIVAVYPHPRQRPLIGYRAIIAAHGADSHHGRHARFLNKLHEFGWRHRGLQHREAAGLPAPLVEEPDLDAVGAELVTLFGLRRRGAEARSDVA